MRIDKDAKKLIGHHGGTVGAGLRVQQALGYADKVRDFTHEADRLCSDLKALEAAAPGEAPAEVVAATAERLGDVAWAAILALTSMGLSAQQVMGMRREHMLRGEQPLRMVDYVTTVRQMGGMGDAGGLAAVLARK